jgi:hypothetical protein
MTDNQPDGEEQPANDDWCSINEAARRLGVTPTAIRNRIKRRTLKTKPNGNHGRLTLVPCPTSPTITLPVPITVAETVSGTVSHTVSNTVSGTVPGTNDSLLTELRGRVDDLQNRLTSTQAEVITMARNLGAAQSEIAALQQQATEARADRDAWRHQAERLATPPARRFWFFRKSA